MPQLEPVVASTLVSQSVAVSIFGVYSLRMSPHPAAPPNPRMVGSVHSGASGSRPLPVNVELLMPHLGELMTIPLPTLSMTKDVFSLNPPQDAQPGHSRLSWSQSAAAFT